MPYYPHDPDTTDWMTIYEESAPSVYMNAQRRGALLDTVVLNKYRDFFEGIGRAIRTTEDLDVFLLGDGFQRYGRDLGITDWYGAQAPTSQLVESTDVAVWSPAAIRAACCSQPYSAISLIEKRGLTSEQCEAIADGLRDVEKPSSAFWSSFRSGLRNGRLDLGLAGVQKLLRLSIQRDKDGSWRPRPDADLDNNIQRLPVDVLVSLPTLPEWDSRWLAYFGYSAIPLPEAFWREAYRVARQNPGHYDSIKAWPGFLYYPDMARDLRVGGVVRYPTNAVARTRMLSGCCGRTGNLFGPWSQWHGEKLKESLCATVAELLHDVSNPATVRELAKVIAAWPSNEPLPRTLLFEQDLPTSVQNACRARWGRSPGGPWGDWKTLCESPPSDVSTSASLYLLSLSPVERLTYIARIPESHRQVWTLFWATDPAACVLVDEIEAVRVSATMALQAERQRKKDARKVSHVIPPQAKADPVRRTQKRVRKIEKSGGPASLDLQQRLVPRAKELLQRATAWPTVGEVLERLETMAMAKLAPEYGLSDSGLRNMLSDAGVGMSTLPRRRPRAR